VVLVDTQDSRLGAEVGEIAKAEALRIEAKILTLSTALLLTLMRLQDRRWRTTMRRPISSTKR
jgi:hypothetical protein